MSESLQLWVAVTAGGAVGSLLRHAVSVLINSVTMHVVPFAVGLVNVGGCFVIGVLAGAIATGRWAPSMGVRAFVFVGVLGGFTTFSSLALDTLTLVHHGRPLVAASNVALQVALGLAAVFGGYALLTR